MRTTTTITMAVNVVIDYSSDSENLPVKAIKEKARKCAIDLVEFGLHEAVKVVTGSTVSPLGQVVAGKVVIE